MFTVTSCAPPPCSAFKTTDGVLRATRASTGVVRVEMSASWVSRTSDETEPFRFPLSSVFSCLA